MARTLKYAIVTENPDKDVRVVTGFEKGKPTLGTMDEGFRLGPVLAEHVQSELEKHGTLAYLVPLKRSPKLSACDILLKVIP